MRPLRGRPCGIELARAPGCLRRSVAWPRPRRAPTTRSHPAARRPGRWSARSLDRGRDVGSFVPRDRLAQPGLEVGRGLPADPFTRPARVQRAAWLAVGFARIPADPALEAG